MKFLPGAATLVFLALVAPANAQDAAPPLIIIMTVPASSSAPVPAPPIVAQLEAATKDLQMTSETDAPFRVVFYPISPPENEPKESEKPAKKAPETETAPTPEAIAKLAGAPGDAKLETRDLDEFFANAVLVEDWMEDDEKATAKRFAALLETLKTALRNPQVVVWGDAQKQVAIIGQVDGGLAGVLTVVVET